MIELNAFERVAKQGTVEIINIEEIKLNVRTILLDELAYIQKRIKFIKKQIRACTDSEFAECDAYYCLLEDRINDEMRIKACL